MTNNAYSKGGGDLKHRTKQLALRVVNLCIRLNRRSSPHRSIANQIMRSGTSVGANYREACLAKSQADFINKMKICEAEADETCYWLEILMESPLMRRELLTDLYNEACQITAIMSASIISAKRNLKRQTTRH